MNRCDLKSGDPTYSVIVGFDFSRKLWFAQLYDETQRKNRLMVDMNRVKNKTILNFIKVYADPNCPYVKKIKDVILNNLDPKSIFT